MRKRLCALVLHAVVPITSSCGDDSDTGTARPVEDGVTVDDLVGSWSASSHTFTNKADATQSIDIITIGGETRSTVLAGGRARTWVELGDFSDEWDAQLSISGNTITSTPVEASRDGRVSTFVLSGNVLTTTNGNSTFDFTLSGEPEVPATEVIVWQRQ